MINSFGGAINVQAKAMNPSAKKEWFLSQGNIRLAFPRLYFCQTEYVHISNLEYFVGLLRLLNYAFLSALNATKCNTGKAVLNKNISLLSIIFIAIRLRSS